MQVHIHKALFIAAKQYQLLNPVHDTLLSESKAELALLLFN